MIVDIGYNNANNGFDGKTCAVLTSIDEQSDDIALGVNKSLESKKDGATSLTGAGDQGMMFGYACNETPELMPMPISLAHKLAQQLATVRKNGTLSYLRPDGKTQVTIEYIDDKPSRVDTIVVSTQHSDKITLDQIRKDIIKYVVNPIVSKNLLDDSTSILVNPTGRFVVGGPQGIAD